MTTALSFSDLAQRLEHGDPDAAAILFYRYAHRLIGLARRRLDARVRPRVDADAVANSVLRTFCRRHAERPFDLDGEDALWALLAEITLRKCNRWNRHFHTRKRDVRREQAPAAGDDSSIDEPLGASAPSPEDAAILNDLLEQLLNGLDAQTRQVCEMRLQGYQIKEMAAELNCTDTTIYRKLERIKKRLHQLCPPE